MSLSIHLDYPLSKELFLPPLARQEEEEEASLPQGTLPSLPPRLAASQARLLFLQ